MTLIERAYMRKCQDCPTTYYDPSGRRKRCPKCRDKHNREYMKAYMKDMGWKYRKDLKSDNKANASSKS